jgi:diguanylate cyclase
MSVTGLWQWAKGYREGMFYSLAFVPLMTSMTLLGLSVLGKLPPNLLGPYAWQLAALFEVGVLAIGLADSVQRMKAAKLRAEREARQAQQALTTQLESQVQERTRALEMANRKLQALAIQDELTGAFNRRHFNQVCRATLASPRRDEPVLLCMFDIDHFKSYNDHHGHQAGDWALTAVAHAVADQLRRSGDHLFRLGGEEFGVLVTARDAASAGQFIENLRQAVRGLAMRHDHVPAGVLTASFGAVWWSGAALQGLDPDTMYAAADRQLYQAKAAGRDRVCMALVGDVPVAGPGAAPVAAQ